MNTSETSKKSTKKSSDGVEKLKNGIDISSSQNQRQKKIEDEIDLLFDEAATVLCDKPTLQNTIFERLQTPKLALQNLHKIVEPETTLCRAEFETKAISAIINREQQILDEEESLRKLVPRLITVYILFIILAIILGKQFGENPIDFFVVGIPLPILIWSAIGSLGAILYRFYTHEFGRMRQEIKWLIARPIIGIIMGSIAYLSIIAGLIIFNGEASKIGTNTKPQLLWIIAFLGGFSDKFFEAIIDVIVAKIAKDKHEDDDANTEDQDDGQIAQTAG